MKFNKTSRRVLKFFVVFFILILFTEIYLRDYWGFCDSVLMMEDKQYEYIAQANQHRFRFRNHVDYNSFSMRSPEPDSSAYKILGFGDSIINGGVMVDQDSTATNILSKGLSADLKKSIQVLNIGAGSWGPDNCYAYLQQKGDFNAKMIFLVVSSHDAFDNMDFKPVVDKVIRYESKQYRFAIWELCEKYILPRLHSKLPSEDLGVIKNGTVFNTGFQDLYEYSKLKQVPFFIYLNPDKNELLEMKYNWQGQQIIEFCKKNRIRLIQGLKTTKVEDYRGIIHMNVNGQRHMASALAPVIKEYMQL